MILLLILYGVINAEQGAAWQALIIALAAVLVPLILTGVAKTYGNNRTALKREAIAGVAARAAAGAVGAMRRGVAMAVTDCGPDCHCRACGLAVAAGAAAARHADDPADAHGDGR